MEVLMPLTIGALVAISLYLLLRRYAFSLVIGLILLGHAVNLLLFSAGGLDRDAVPILEKDAHAAGPAPVADPLPQALILTAIVISLGVQAFVLGLVYRLGQIQRDLDLERARSERTEGS